MAKRKPPKAEVPETSGATPASAEEVAVAQGLQIVQMPEWYASGSQLVIAGNDAQIIFNKPMLLGDTTHGLPTLSHNVAVIAPVGMVRMSIGTLKDLSILLSEQVAKREAEEGVIHTAFTRMREAARSRGASSKKKH